MVWKLADAKNKFSEVVDLALEEGPQKITRRDQSVMVISMDEFERLQGKKQDFKSFLLSAPSMKDLDLTRDRSPMREIEL